MKNYLIAAIFLVGLITGTHTFTVQATNGIQTARRIYTLEVVGP